MKQQLIEAMAACKQAAWVEDYEALVYTSAGKTELQTILGEAGITLRFTDESLKVQWPNGMSIRVIHYLVTDDEFCRLTGRTRSEIAQRDQGAIQKRQEMVNEVICIRDQSDTDALIVFHQLLAEMVPAEQAATAMASLNAIMTGPATPLAIDHYVRNFADIVELMPDPTDALAQMPSWVIMLLFRDEGADGSTRAAESAWTTLPSIPIAGFKEELRGKDVEVRSKLARILVKAFAEWQEVVSAIRLLTTNLQEKVVMEAQIKLCQLLHCVGEDVLSIERDCVPQELREYFAELYQEATGVPPWENDWENDDDQ